MGTHRLQAALKQLSEAIRAVEAVIDEMRAEHDALALHIFIARRNYRRSKDTKSGKRRDTTALLSFHKACNLGFRGNLAEWNRLLGAAFER